MNLPTPIAPDSHLSPQGSQVPRSIARPPSKTDHCIWRTCVPNKLLLVWNLCSVILQVPLLGILCSLTPAWALKDAYLKILIHGKNPHAPTPKPSDFDYRASDNLLCLLPHCLKRNSQILRRLPAPSPHCELRSSQLTPCISTPSLYASTWRLFSPNMARCSQYRTPTKYLHQHLIEPKNVAPTPSTIADYWRACFFHNISFMLAASPTRYLRKKWHHNAALSAPTSLHLGPG